MAEPVLFVTSFRTRLGLDAVRRMAGSLRAFGGALGQAPLWVFTPEPSRAGGLTDARTRLLPLTVQERMAPNPFAGKVSACAQAEALAPPDCGTLVWIDPGVLVVQPPELFTLGPECDAAFRPVHIRNVGLPPGEPLDAFWGGIYQAAGIHDLASTVTSFVDGVRLRSYFNTHAFSINPRLGLLERWAELFSALVADPAFQQAACSDEDHQVFLFQAVLSTLVATALPPERLRLLPPSYNYPYNLQERIPADRRLASLNETVCFTPEERSVRPEEVRGIALHEPLRSWLTGLGASGEEEA